MTATMPVIDLDAARDEIREADAWLTHAGTLTDDPQALEEITSARAALKATAEASGFVIEPDGLSTDGASLQGAFQMALECMGDAMAMLDERDGSGDLTVAQEDLNSGGMFVVFAANSCGFELGADVRGCWEPGDIIEQFPDPRS